MTGWICPKCGSVYAPFVAECRFCTTGIGLIETSATTMKSVCPGCGQDRSAPPLTGCPRGWHTDILIDGGYLFRP